MKITLLSNILEGIVNFKKLYLPIFSTSDTKLVIFDKNWVGKIPHKWYFGQINQIIPCKSDKFGQVCAIINHTQILLQKLSLMMLITDTNFVFKLHLVFVPIWGKMLVPYCMTKRQKNHCFNMVRLRKISFAESRGSSRFFNNKVVSDFDFWHFLKKSI